jgi:hypothetical protein
MESVGNAKPWTIDPERRAYGLRVVLPKRTYVLPWAQFLYAEMVTVLQQPLRAETFLPASGPARLGRGGPPD